MDLRTHRNTILLIRQVFDRKSSTIPIIETRPQKPACSYLHPIDQAFNRSSPEAQGIDSSHIARFIEEWKNDETLDPHGLMILRNGVVVAECTFGAYDQRIWHITHSECKSITALAIGMLIDEGKLSLDDKIVKILEKHTAVVTLLTHKALTVRHLLMMSTGIVFNEAGAVTETDWIRSFLESAIRGEPGKRFDYNSMNTYMLSAIIRQVSGQGLMEYLEERLWEPLGIRDVFWETCPRGIEKGGWGLYIRPEDMAKIGQLVLQNGEWKGRQLISGNWIREACSLQIETPESYGQYDYGYQIWVGRKQNKFLFNGMFGQNVIGFPDINLLIVSNSGNEEIFQQRRFFELIEKYFPEDFRPVTALPENPESHSQLLALQRSLVRMPFARPAPRRPLYLKNRTLTSLRELYRELDGRTYIADPDESPAVGLLPLITQMVQNNYTKGLKSLGFSLEGDVLVLTVKESDETHRLPVGFDAPETADLSFHGEPYRVGVTGTFTTDEDDRLVLKLRVSFLEIANARLLKIFFFKDKIVTKWLESPGKNFLMDGLAIIGHIIKLGPLFNTILGRVNNNAFNYRIDSLFEPTVTCRLDEPE